MLRSRLVKLLARWLASRDLRRPVRVAIDGIDAAGKTTFADELAPQIASRGRPTIRGSVDGFHNPRKIRYAQGPLSPVGFYRDSFNYESLKKDLLEPLGPAGSRRYRTASFDVRAEAAVTPEVLVAPANAILVFDGIFLCRPGLREYWDTVILLDVDRDVAMARGVERDAQHYGGPDATRVRYEERYRPGQDLYLSECQPQSSADVVIDNTDLLDPQILKGSKLFS